MMNQTLWNQACQHYALGAPAGSPQPVAGGMRHALYHAEASSGTYAVKSLRADVSNPNWRADAAGGEHLARRMAQAGLPAVCALVRPTGPLCEFGDTTLVVFPWQDGTTLPPGPASSEAAAQMGALLARIHQHAPAAQSLPAAAAHTPGEWEDLARQAAEENVAWAETVANALPDIVRWSGAAQAALRGLAGSEIFTHRDLDQKNVLWSNPRTPWLLDWEGAGPLPPALEVMGTALNWAGQAAGTPQAEPFLAFVRAYARQASPPLFDEDALALSAQAVPDKWLVWLKFNMARSLPGGAQANAAEREVACGAVLHSLRTLQAMDTELPLRLSWCAQA